MQRLLFSVILAAAVMVLTGSCGAAPIIYSTDLYHPHDDPDDHYDLLTLFAMDEFDIRAIIIDTGERGKDRPGIPALEQAMHLAGKEAPYSTGLVENLASLEDTGAAQPEAAQAGVDLILSTLRASSEPVTVFVTGSLRDVAAAYNREPALLKEKVGRLYVNAGHSAGKEEWNVKLDRLAYVRVLRSGLPVYWIPCFGEDGYGSLWEFKQGDVLKAAPEAVQNFIIYCQHKVDPEQYPAVEYLSRTPDGPAFEEICAQKRRMWCTAAFLHAAGRAMATCSFPEVNVVIEEDGKTVIDGDAPGAVKLATFHVDEPADYAGEMTQVLAALFRAFGQSK